MSPKNETPKWDYLKSIPSDKTGPKVEWKPVLWEEVDALEIEGKNEIPETFKESAREVSRFITLLDKNPDAAMKDPKINRFVNQLAKTGFIGSVYFWYASAFDRGPDPAQALPKWLQKDFLHRHGIDFSEELTPAEEQEIEELFNVFVSGLSFHDNPYGRYYELEKESAERNKAHDFKYYLESKDLLRALRSGTLKRVFETLHKQHISPFSFKLFEGTRLVLYFQHAIEKSGDRVADVFASASVIGRGPAQDVYKIIQKEGQLSLESGDLSNDSALGDAGRNPIEYKDQVYDPHRFLKTYTDLCLFAGKNPAEPYKTSFVYFISPKGESLKQSVLDEARLLAGYPVFVASSRRQALTIDV